MTSRISGVAIDASDLELVARFWCDVLGYQELERDEGIISIGVPGGSGPDIDVIQVPEPKELKNRLHLDLRVAAGSAGDELARLLDLGARRVDVGQAPDVSWTVLADPEGNEFCLLGTSADPTG